MSSIKARFFESGIVGPNRNGELCVRADRRRPARGDQFTRDSADGSRRLTRPTFRMRDIEACPIESLAPGPVKDRPECRLRLSAAAEVAPALSRARNWREIRLDLDPAVQPDIVCSITDMSPVATDSVDAIWSSHNLEHLQRHEVPLALQSSSGS